MDVYIYTYVNIDMWRSGFVGVFYCQWILRLFSGPRYRKVEPSLMAHPGSSHAKFNRNPQP